MRFALSSCLSALRCSAVLAIVACTELTPSYQDPTPDARIAAIAETAQAGRTQDIPNVIDNLQSDDSAVRMAAIGALRRLTGETLGYRFDAGINERQQAIARWVQWLAEHPTAR